MLITLFILLMLNLPVFADGIYKPNEYHFNSDDKSAKILFILDYSNSMSEYLENGSKVDLMIMTMAKILSLIDSNISVGLRVYGHKTGFTPLEACRASSLLVPIAKGVNSDITNALRRTKPKGMTPITYSLKQAVKYDFLGVSGPKHIILLTDGGENCDESPCEYIMDLVKYRRDISIDVIAFNINDKDDLSQLECVALVSSGKFYTANTAAELAKSLNNSINRQKQVEAKIITNY